MTQQLLTSAQSRGSRLVPLGQRILEQACCHVHALQRRHAPSPPLWISVNLSDRELQNPTLVADVARTLDRTGLDPRTLVLEITESHSIDDATIAKLEEL